MKRTFELHPRLACFLGVKELTAPDIVQQAAVSVIYLSQKNGVVVGYRDTPLARYGWPIKLQDEINKHFGTVFALRHEDWTERGPSPRAQYLDSLVPWTVEVDEEPA